MIDERTNAELEAAVRRTLRRTPPRFLAAGGRGGNGHGYLAQPPRELPVVADPPELLERIAAATAMCDEPEVAEVDPALSRLLAAQQRAVDLVELRDIRKTLSLEHRMMDARRQAKRRHVDIRQALYVIAKMAPRNLGAALGRMEILEALLDGAQELESELA